MIITSHNAYVILSKHKLFVLVQGILILFIVVKQITQIHSLVFLVLNVIFVRQFVGAFEPLSQEKQLIMQQILVFIVVSIHILLHMPISMILLLLSLLFQPQRTISTQEKSNNVANKCPFVFYVIPVGTTLFKLMELAPNVKISCEAKYECCRWNRYEHCSFLFIIRGTIPHTHNKSTKILCGSFFYNHNFNLNDWLKKSYLCWIQ